MKRKLLNVAVALLCAAISGSLPVPALCNPDIAITTDAGEQVGLYKTSHALLIGAGEYQGKWPDLESIPKDLENVKAVLEQQEFAVETILDPNSETMEETIEGFIDRYGYDRENRLLFYFAGHGHTMDNGTRGYLVPVDAPDPKSHPADFKRMSLDMNQIISWCRQMDARHVLFLFDSCFSGTIFKQRDLPQTPPQITALTAKPVRLFITAGSAGESVPAKSTFTPAFIDAINHNLADLNRDGYITGTELGVHLQNIIPRHTSQTPQYGKISDYELSRGDFVFLSGKQVSRMSSRQDSSSPASTESNRRSVEQGSSPAPRLSSSAPIQKKRTNEKLPDTPSILILSHGNDTIHPLFQAGLESSMRKAGLKTSSVKNLPRLKEKVEMGGTSVNWYDIKEFVPKGTAHLLVITEIRNAGSMTLEYHGRSTELTTAAYTVSTVDLISGETVSPPISGAVKFTPLNLHRKIRGAALPAGRRLTSRLNSYWRDKRKKGL